MGLAAKVEDAFGSSAHRGYADTYLAEIRTNWRDTERDLRRTLAVAVVLAVAFELLTRGTATEATIGFVKVANTTVLQKAIPIVAGYLSFAIVNLVVQSAALRAVHDVVVRAVYPKIVQGELEKALVPGNAVFYSQEPTYALLDSWARVPSVVGFTRVFAVVAAPVAFVIYGFVRLFQLYGGDAFIWVGIVISSVFVIVAILLFATAWNEPNFSD